MLKQFSPGACICSQSTVPAVRTKASHLLTGVSERPSEKESFSEVDSELDVRILSRSSRKYGWLRATRDEMRRSGLNTSILWKDNVQCASTTGHTCICIRLKLSGHLLHLTSKTAHRNVSWWCFIHRWVVHNKHKSGCKTVLYPTMWVILHRTGPQEGTVLDLRIYKLLSVSVSHTTRKTMNADTEENLDLTLCRLLWVYIWYNFKQNHECRNTETRETASHSQGNINDGSKILHSTKQAFSCVFMHHFLCIIYNFH